MSEFLFLFFVFIVYPLVLVGSIPATLIGIFWLKDKLLGKSRDTFGQEK